MMTFNFLLCDQTAITSAFDVRPVSYPVPSSSVVITGDPIYYTESPQEIDLVPNVYKVQCNVSSTNDWFISGSDVTASANIISGSYLSESVSRVLFDFADSIHTLGTVKKVEIRPAAKNVGWQDYFVLSDAVTYTTDDNGSITLDLVPMAYNVKYFGTKKHTSFSIVASGSCTASAIMATSVNVASVITPQNAANFAYVASVSDARYELKGGGSDDTTISCSWASSSLSSSLATSASYASFSDTAITSETASYLTETNNYTVTNLQVNGTLINGTGVSSTIGTLAHAEGKNCTAKGVYSHAEGENAVAHAKSSHAEGLNTLASGSYSHAEGQSTIAKGVASYANGLGTEAFANYQSVVGKYNVLSNNTDLFVVGGGTSNGSRKDILNVDANGVRVTGNISCSVITASLYGTASAATYWDSSSLVQWVENLLQSNVYYLTGTGSSAAGYAEMRQTNPNPLTYTFVSSSIASGQYAYAFITPAGDPNTTILPSGVYQVDFIARITNGSGVTTLTPEIYLANSLGVTYFELPAGGLTNPLTTTFTRYQPSIIVDSLLTMSATDRVVLKLKCATTTATKDFELQVGGTALSHFSTPLPSITSTPLSSSHALVADNATSASYSKVSQTSSIVQVPLNSYAFNTVAYPQAGIFFNSTTPGLNINDTDGTPLYSFGVATNPVAQFVYPLTVPSVTGSLKGTASFAVSASYAPSVQVSASWASASISASFATTSSYSIKAKNSETSSLATGVEAGVSLVFGDATFRQEDGVVIEGTVVFESGDVSFSSPVVFGGRVRSEFPITASLNGTASWAITSSYATSASYVLGGGVFGTVSSASYALASLSASYAPSAGGVTPGGSYNISASWASSSINAVTAAFASTIPANISVTQLTSSKSVKVNNPGGASTFQKDSGVRVWDSDFGTWQSAATLDAYIPTATGEWNGWNDLFIGYYSTGHTYWGTTCAAALPAASALMANGGLNVAGPFTASGTFKIPTHTGTTPAGAAIAGRMSYNTATNFLYIGNGSAWKSASFA